MSIAKVTEITSASTKSFEDAIRQGIKRAAQTVHGMQSAWVNEEKVVIRDDDVAEWRVNLKVSFVLDDTAGDKRTKAA
jgi:flavin-binding protein dodecin